MLRDRAFVWIQFLAQSHVGMEGDGGEGGGLGKRSGQEEDGAGRRWGSRRERGVFTYNAIVLWRGRQQPERVPKTTVGTDAA